MISAIFRRKKYRVKNSENDIDGVMLKILKQSYQPLTFERFFAVYMMWYDDELVRKFHGEVFPSLLTKELGEVKEG